MERRKRHEEKLARNPMGAGLFAMSKTIINQLKQENIMKIHKSIMTFVVSIATLSSTMAGHVDVKNENKKGLKVRISAEGNSTEVLPSYIQEIPAEETFRFRVDSSNLGGKSHYSIKGATTAFTGDKCIHLSVEKDYAVTFLNDTVGTTCLAEEITLKK